MADSDYINADRIGVLESASKVSLVGGGACLIAALLLVAKANDGGSSWDVNGWWVAILLIGAVLLGIAATIARVLDASFRTRMAISLIEKQGTSDPKVAEEIIKRIGSPLEQYVVAPRVETEQPDGQMLVMSVEDLAEALRAATRRA